MKVNFENSSAPNLRFEPRTISCMVDDHQTTQLPRVPLEFSIIVNKKMQSGVGQFRRHGIIEGGGGDGVAVTGS